jgi:hypothetical protein
LGLTRLAAADFATLRGLLAEFLFRSFACLGSFDRFFGLAMIALAG